MKLLYGVLLICCGVFAQDDAPAGAPAVPATPPPPGREQARSMIVTQYGIVAASQFLASQAGAKMLEAGGNAIDAAIAANAVLGLTQPYVNGLGGDLFAIVYEAKTGQVYGLNSSGWTPKALTIDYLKSKGIDKIDSRGVHAITVPGCVAGWDALRQIAAKGRDGYYKGKLAESLVKFLREQGGAHTLEDFAEFEPEWVEPISTTYRGWQVYELPPNGQGVAALSMLNIMENFPLKDYGHNSAAALHVMIEAKKLAYADMARFVGDPRFGPVPVAEMLSKDLAKRRAGQIDMDKAACKVLPSEIRETLAAHGNETIYMSAIDKEGNIVSLIQSNYSGYGTGMVAHGAGFSFHNRGAGFDLMPGKPNSLAGRKRPLHTIIPAFMRKGDLSIGFGIMGGWNQSQAHAQFVANVVDFGMNVQMALEAARFTKGTFDGCDVQMETRVPEAVRQDLARRGHVIAPLAGFSGAMGNGEAVMRDAKRGVNFAGSDPRTDGAAIPEQPAAPSVRG